MLIRFFFTQQCNWFHHVFCFLLQTTTKEIFCTFLHTCWIWPNLKTALKGTSESIEWERLFFFFFGICWFVDFFAYFDLCIVYKRSGEFINRKMLNYIPHFLQWNLLWLEQIVDDWQYWWYIFLQIYKS